MIPETPAFSVDTTEDFETLPTKTFRLDMENGRIMGNIDDSEAVMQFIKKVLDTSKYAYEIYDWYYGNQLYLLVGHSKEILVPRLPTNLENAQ